jgi:hypothetical protein
LFVVALPWPASTTTGANSAMAIVVRIASANSVRSSNDSPARKSSRARSSTTGAVRGAATDGFHHGRFVVADLSSDVREGASVRAAAAGPANQPADSASANGETRPPLAA